MPRGPVDPLSTLLGYLEQRTAPPVDWVNKHAPGSDLTALWTVTRNAYVMAQLVSPVLPAKTLVRAGCACVGRALMYLPLDELRPADAVEAAEKWSRGSLAIEQLETAAAAARSAATAVFDSGGLAATYAAKAAEALKEVAVGQIGLERVVHHVANAVDEAGVHTHDDALADLAALLREYLLCPSLPELVAAFKNRRN